MLNIAIVGKPNSGKSTLFNKLCGRKTAITSSVSGTTRDRREASCKIQHIYAKVIDTAGIEEDELCSEIEQKMHAQSYSALELADLALFVLDGRLGITEADKIAAEKLRRSGRPTIIIVNKSENLPEPYEPWPFYKLGLGENVCFVSAEHNRNIQDLCSLIVSFFEQNLDKFSGFVENEEEFTEKTKKKASKVRVAIVGKPNSGKSTIINGILNEDRLITSPIAGTTRDSIEIDFKYNGTDICIIDTAGIRQKSKIDPEELERLCVIDAFNAIRFCHIAILVMDIRHPYEKQDLAILHRVVEEGRVIIFVLNKSDLITNSERKKTVEFLQKELARIAPEAKTAPFIIVSALEKTNLSEIMDSSIKGFEEWNMKFSTSKLNKWLLSAQQKKQPPLYKGAPIKLKYITQGRTRPPSFIIFSNHPKGIPESYLSFLEGDMRKTLGLNATPIRFWLRKTGNPYN